MNTNTSSNSSQIQKFYVTYFFQSLSSSSYFVYIHLLYKISYQFLPKNTVSLFALTTVIAETTKKKQKKEAPF